MAPCSGCAVLFIGPSGSGKSTLIAGLLDGKPGDAGSPAPDAPPRRWKVDTLRAERELGRTIELKVLPAPEIAAPITSFLDVSGAPELIKSVPVGASQATVCVLCWSTAQESDEVARDVAAQHLQCARALGVTEVIVAVTHVPSDGTKVLIDQSPALDLVAEAGFSEAAACLPVLEDGSSVEWWDGPTLLETIARVGEQSTSKKDDGEDKPSIGRAPNEGKLCVPVQAVYKVTGSGTVVVGRIQAGVVHEEETVVFMPGEVKAVVDSIEFNHARVSEAGVGANVGLALSISNKAVRRGMVCMGGAVPYAVRTIDAQITIFRTVAQVRKGLIYPGYTPTLHAHTAAVPCMFAALLWSRASEGDSVQTNPESIAAGDTALVRLQPISPIYVEPMSDEHRLGLLLIRDAHKTIGAGFVVATN